MWAEGLPSAHLFGLDDARIKATVRKTLDDMSQYLRARGAPDPGWLYPST
jgi:outer membrane protein OmpA-like peptidoglycan-associated protein